MAELLLETAGTVVVLALIVYLVRRVYGTPVSEYGRLLEQMPAEDYAHLDTSEIERQLETAKEEMQRLESILATRRMQKRLREAKKLKRRIEALRMALLKYELSKRSGSNDEQVS